MRCDGPATQYRPSVSSGIDYYDQPRKLFNLMSNDAKQRLANNITDSLLFLPDVIGNRMVRLVRVSLTYVVENILPM